MARGARRRRRWPRRRRPSARGGESEREGVAERARGVAAPRQGRERDKHSARPRGAGRGARPGQRGGAGRGVDCASAAARQRREEGGAVAPSRSPSTPAQPGLVVVGLVCGTPVGRPAQDSRSRTTSTSPSTRASRASHQLLDQVRVTSATARTACSAGTAGSPAAGSGPAVRQLSQRDGLVGAGRARLRAPRRRHNNRPSPPSRVWGSAVQCRVTGPPALRPPARSTVALRSGIDFLKRSKAPARPSQGLARTSPRRVAR